jgi:hypothetical protein
MIEKALSIRQPWAHAIIHLGKDIENRDWKHAPSYRGPILIHAALGCTREEYDGARDTIGDLRNIDYLPDLADLPRGGIVGRARIVDVVIEHGSPWFFGPLGFVLADVEPLPFYRRKGQLGFFDVDMSLPPDPEPAPRVKAAKSAPVVAPRQRSLF